MRILLAPARRAAEKLPQVQTLRLETVNIPTKSVRVIDHAKAGARIRALRQKQKMPLAKLAAQIGLKSFSHLSDLERGKRNWTQELWDRAIIALLETPN